MVAIYYVLVVVMFVLGLFYFGYFYCFHLFYVVVGNDILLRVIQSVTKNGASLLWVTALMVIVIYIYSLVAFAFLRKNFDEDEGAFCETSFQCFITSLRLGLMSGGGLGEALPAFTEGFREPGYRTFFDLSFFILVTTIGLNVVFGIIVDTFSELRDEKFSKKESMESECFICGLKANEFDRFTEGGFSHHVKHEHNMWTYIAYFLHLDEKEPTEYTSHEQFVKELYDDNDNKFFPVNHALSLVGVQDSNVETKLVELESKINLLLAQYEQEQLNRAEEEKKREVQQYKLRRRATRNT
jgi:inositol 1,4,5-triphosphate receptor type 1